MVEPITLELQLPCSIDKAFEVFTSDFTKWWPREYSWSQEAMASIGIEPCIGGRCTETGPHGFQLDWGRVLEWQPPQKLIMTWQIGADRVPQPNPDNASIIEVVFTAIADAQTQVLFEHRDLHRHGEGAEDYRQALNSEYGWPFILEKYRTLVERI